MLERLGEFPEDEGKKGRYTNVKHEMKIFGILQKNKCSNFSRNVPSELG